jgi:hypothetical protein
MKINSEILEGHPNYFNQKKYLRFDNLNYMEKINKFKKYGLNDQLAFKEIQIDPFIEEANSTLKSASMHCKSLIFYFTSIFMDDRSGYFIFPLFENFYNLNNLFLLKCEIPFINFYNLLGKLQSLDILQMYSINLILTPSEDPNLAIFLQYPKSLKELSYIFVDLCVSDIYNNQALYVLKDSKFRFRGEKLDIIPQVLPNLKILNVCESEMATRRTSEFLALNPDVECCMLLPEQ